MSAVTMDRATAQALLLHAAKNDVRHYLNTVALEVAADRCIAIATDGTTLLATTEGVELREPPPCRDGTYLVDRVALEPALKTKNKDVLTFTFDADDPQRVVVTAAAAQFHSRVDGKFPDWRRVVHRPADSEGHPAAIAPEFLTRCTQSISLLCTGRKTAAANYANALVPYGPNRAAIAVGDDYVDVCMSRSDPFDDPKPLPAWV